MNFRIYGICIVSVTANDSILRQLSYISDPYFKMDNSKNCDVNFSIESCERAVVKDILKKTTKKWGYSNWEFKDNMYYIYDDYSTFSYFIVNLESRKIIHYSSNAEVQAYDLFRFIRNLAIGELQEKEYLCLHGAALNIRNEGILITGDKFSGKTTLMIELLLKNKDEIEFITNDVGMYNCEQSIGYGIPKSVSIRYITSKTLNFELSSEYKYDLNLYENSNGIKWDSKKRVSVREFSSNFNCQLSPKGDIKTVVYLKYVEEFKITQIEDLNKRKKILQRQILRNSEEQLYGGSCTPDEDRNLLLLSQRIKNFYVVEMDKFYQQKRVADELIKILN